MNRFESPDFTNPKNRKAPTVWRITRRVHLLYWPMWRKLWPWDFRYSREGGYVMLWAFELRW